TEPSIAYSQGAQRRIWLERIAQSDFPAVAKLSRRRPQGVQTRLAAVHQGRHGPPVCARHVHCAVNGLALANTPQVYSHTRAMEGDRLSRRMELQVGPTGSSPGICQAHPFGDLLRPSYKAPCFGERSCCLVVGTASLLAKADCHFQQRIKPALNLD